MIASRTLGLVAAAVVTLVTLAACGGEGVTPFESVEPEADVDETYGAEPPVQEDEASPPAAASTPVQPSDYEAEKAWAAARGFTVPAGEVTVIGQRRGADARSTKYEDTLVVFRADGTVVRFEGTTKPAQMPNPQSSVVPDVDKDGRKDLGIVRPGVYEARGSVTFGIPGHKRPAYKVYTDAGSTSLPAWRDLTGDGVYSDAEKSTSEQRAYTIGGIYIHYGFDTTGTTIDGAKYVGPWSVGCQNVKYAELDAFITAVGGEDAVFTYAILEE